MEYRLVGVFVASPNGHASVENRKATARRPVKFGIQVGICRKHGFYDIAVESVQLAAGAGCGRRRVRRASEKTDFAHIVAGPDVAGRLLPRKLDMGDFNNPRGDYEECGFRSPLREQQFSWFERSGF
jgi:hypothetical protein